MWLSANGFRVHLYTLHEYHDWTFVELWVEDLDANYLTKGVTGER